MSINQYWTGQIPAAPISITVYDSNGYPKNLSSYTTITPVLVGSDNELLDLTGSVVLNSGGGAGRIVFKWPTDRSLFEKAGEYLLQLELTNEAGARDYTDTHTIIVRRLGGVY